MGLLDVFKKKEKILTIAEVQERLYGVLTQMS